MDEAGEIKLPKDFVRILMEVIDPRQSLDYFDCNEGISFPVQVLPISVERLIVNIGKLSEDKELATVRACGELVHFYYPQFTRDWAANHLSIPETELFYQFHLHKQEYNDQIIDVVRQVEDRIKWAPLDEEDKKESEKYRDAWVFNVAYGFVNFASENYLTHDFVGKTTRGLAELIRLSNLVSSDRFRSKIKPSQKREANPMEGVETLEDYMSGLQAQGVDLKKLF